MINKQQKQQFKLLSQQCREQYIPVVREKTADLLCSLIEKNSNKKLNEFDIEQNLISGLEIIKNKFIVDKITDIFLTFRFKFSYLSHSIYESGTNNTHVVYLIHITKATRQYGTS